VTTAYLFRIDGAKDNDEFFVAFRPLVSQVYAGIDVRIGSSGWVPDFIKVVVDEAHQGILITLMELEATESVALISCRKYLPESSTDIVETFGKYLDRVIRHCQSTADDRKNEFVRLKARLLEAKQVNVTTAGALRSATSFVEEISLIDQPQRFVQTRQMQPVLRKTIPIFRGNLRLSADKAKALSRSVLILDAIVRQRDHSEATFKSWRGKNGQPMKHLLINNHTSYPNLRSFLFGSTNRGITLDFEMLLEELAHIWLEAGKSEFNQENIRVMINNYFPIALKIKGHETMGVVFEAARKHLADKASL
jgi:hypothetical protein